MHETDDILIQNHFRPLAKLDKAELVLAMSLTTASVRITGKTV
jgi:hypothetical protein